MTYSIHTLHSNRSEPTPPPSSWERIANEGVLVVGLVFLLFWVVALISYTPQDTAWTTSGTGAALVNRGGRLGAWIADVSYFLLGYSVWLCVIVAARAWLSLLAKRLRANTGLEDAYGQDPAVRAWWQSPHLIFWFGLLLMIDASAALEWTRMYRLESQLPGHSGGVLGYVLGLQSMQILGFAGSGLVCIGLALLGMSWTFNFSWVRLAEQIGSWLDARWESLRERRELAQDIELGQQAVREREEVLAESRDDVEVHLHTPPVLVEPVLID